MKSVRLELVALEGRDLPSTASAVFQNGLLLVRGDDRGDLLNVAANAAGTLVPTERGQPVPVAGGPATLANTLLVVEQSGRGRGNTLTLDPSVAGVRSTLDASRGRDNVLLPLNRGGSTEIGGRGYNRLFDSPGGLDTLIGGPGHNLFDWEPGTGTDTVLGRGSHDTLFVRGSNAAAGEVDTVTADGSGGFTYSRLNVVPFNIHCSGVQEVVISPGDGNNVVTLGDLAGVRGLREVAVLGGAGDTVFDASANTNRRVEAELVNALGADTLVTGAGRSEYFVGTGSVNVVQTTGTPPAVRLCHPEWEWWL